MFGIKKTGMDTQNFILTGKEAGFRLERMALQIAETLQEDDTPLFLIGVTNSGTTIANLLYAYLKKYLHTSIEILSVNLNKRAPDEVTLSKDIDANGKNIIIVDDVTNSGRTLLYALKPLLSFIPKRIQTLVVIERMHRHFPVKPDYVGQTVATPGNENIVVLIENEQIVGAYVE